jgi:DNA topoisomerase I
VQAVTDPVVADVVRTLKKRRGGGDELLAYKVDGRWTDVKSADINEYVKEAAGGEFSAKDFRTWSGTVLAAVALAVSSGAAARGTKTSRKRAKTHAIKEVAHYLGNTPAIARTSYIDPRIFDRFDGGLTIAGVLPDLAEEADGNSSRQRAIEEGVLDLIARETGSTAVEKADAVAKELQEVAA